MKQPWDPTSGPRPNLSKLSPVDRERISKPIPLRQWETYGFLCIFQSVACNHPNARVHAAPYRVSENDSPVVPEDGVQLDFNDYTGRIPAASAILTRDRARETITAFIKAYIDIGGNVDEILSSMRTERLSVQLPVYVDESKSRD
jgi:hypothetical protein